MRTLEAVAFCCLSTLVLFWFTDRMRDLDFEPIVVIPCEGAACVAYVGPHSGSPWSVFSDALDPRGVVSFSATNVCTQLSDTLQLRGEAAEGVDLILDLITSRGTVAITQPPDGTIVIAPGARNDSFDDVLRDAIRMAPARGCHPINYQSVFWPLWSTWLLLSFWRLLRGRQAEWARR